MIRIHSEIIKLRRNKILTSIIFINTTFENEVETSDKQETNASQASTFYAQIILKKKTL